MSSNYTHYIYIYILYDTNSLNFDRNSLLWFQVFWSSFRYCNIQQNICNVQSLCHKYLIQLMLFICLFDFFLLWIMIVTIPLIWTTLTCFQQQDLMMVWSFGRLFCGEPRLEHSTFSIVTLVRGSSPVGQACASEWYQEMWELLLWVPVRLGYDHLAHAIIANPVRLISSKWPDELQVHEIQRRDPSTINLFEKMVCLYLKCSTRLYVMSIIQTRDSGLWRSRMPVFCLRPRMFCTQSWADATSCMCL